MIQRVLASVKTRIVKNMKKQGNSSFLGFSPLSKAKPRARKGENLPGRSPFRRGGPGTPPRGGTPPGGGGTPPGGVPGLPPAEGRPPGRVSALPGTRFSL